MVNDDEQDTVQHATARTKKVGKLRTCKICKKSFYYERKVTGTKCCSKACEKENARRESAESAKRCYSRITPKRKEKLKKYLWKYREGLKNKKQAS